MTPTQTTIGLALQLWPATEAELAGALGISYSRLRSWRGNFPGSYKLPTEEQADRLVAVVKAELARRLELVSQLPAHTPS